MSIRERLFSEVQTVCGGAGLDFQKVSAEVSDFIGRDEVIDYYIGQGLPDFPDTVLNIMILGEKCLYDCDVRQKGVLLHVLPLSRIIHIAEGFTGEEDDFLSLEFRVAGLAGGLVIQGKLSESGNLRRFSSAVRKKILESI